MKGSLDHPATYNARILLTIAFGFLITNQGAHGFMLSTNTLKNTLHGKEDVLNIAYPMETSFRMPPLYAKKPNKNAGKQISDKRRDQLGIPDDEDEYDLGAALNANTDPLITKIIAGSFILVVAALLVAGIIVPSLADYGEGVCNPIKTGGRC
mmetsp:Transcript_25315/g.29815  ORF Transcript_25315/g.29815 Transcript_25315/m.29815 type:complete len:153 (+) Transcript_25315:65-523(+)